MKNLIALLSLTLTISAIGQQHQVGFKGGIGLNNYVNSFIDFDPRIGFNGGLVYQYRMSKHFQLGFDLLYVQKGMRSTIFFTDFAGNFTGGSMTIKNNYDYLSVPLKVGGTIGNKIKGFLNIGIVPNLLVNAKSINPEIGLPPKKGIPAMKTDISQYTSRLDLGGLIEIGGSFTATDKITLFSDLIYTHSLTSISNQEIFSSTGVRHHGVSANVGLWYTLR